MRTLKIDLTYNPQPKQKLFHTNSAKYRLFLGAWRSGKTFAACQEALKQSILYPKNVGLIGRKDYADLRDTTMKTFFEVVPENLIKRYNKQEHWLLFKNGSEIFFRELKDPLGLGSLDLGWFYIDEAEEVGEDIFRRLKGRLSNTNSKRQCGWITSNPPNKNHWIYKTFEAGESPDCFTVHSSTYDNKEYLPEGYLKDLEKMPESWRRKYLDGEYGFIADGTPFYSGFRDSLHIKEIKANPYKPLLLGWDYGFRHPVCLITQIDDKGRWCILREIMGENIVIDKFSDLVKQILNTSYPGYPSDSYGDPAGSHASDKSEKTSEQILQSKGFNVRSKQSSYRERKEIIEKLLTTLIEDKPSLIVDSSCKTLIDGFLGGYHYPVMKEGSEFQFVKAEAPFKDGHYEHCVSSSTKIRTLNGWHVIEDLIGKSFITYSYDSFNKRLVPAKAHSCRKTQEGVELWKLKFDEGELIATPDHLVMLRDGSYKQLKDLSVGNELMPFYEKQRSVQGHKIINLNDGSIVDEHRYIYSWFNGYLKDGCHIHHIDGNPFNNYPENLGQLEAKKHMQAVYEKMRGYSTVKAMKNGSLNPWTPESREKMRRYLLARYKDGNHPLTRRTDKICPICKKVFSATFRQKFCSNCRNRQRNYREKLKLAQLVNHKVISVEFYGFGDTYNFEVDTYHNFPANGIMVHNCLNALEYIAVNVFGGVIRSRPDFKKLPRVAKAEYDILGF